MTRKAEANIVRPVITLTKTTTRIFVTHLTTREFKTPLTAEQGARIKAIRRPMNRAKARKAEANILRPAIPFRTMTTRIFAMHLTYEDVVYREMDETFQKKGLVPGATYCDPAFLSTSTNPQISFATCPGTTLFVLKYKAGTSVKQYSSHSSEDEVLFALSTLFRILSVTDRNNGGGLRVEMEEIASWNKL
jgi:hypothetical protein